tara:strand:- start:39 stop:359 length:321 start_codon:yes stop_codon:yes gene_type:complete
MVSEAEIKEKVQAHREAKDAVPMANTTIVANEDLENLKKLQADMDNLVVVFGQVAIQELAIKKQKLSITDELDNLKLREVKLAKELSDKYGQGSLDLETGKFTTTN